MQFNIIFMPSSCMCWQYLKSAAAGYQLTIKVLCNFMKNKLAQILLCAFFVINIGGRA